MKKSLLAIIHLLVITSFIYATNVTLYKQITSRSVVSPFELESYDLQDYLDIIGAYQSVNELIQHTQGVYGNNCLSSWRSQPASSVEENIETCVKGLLLNGYPFFMGPIKRINEKRLIKLAGYRTGECTGLGDQENYRGVLLYSDGSFFVGKMRGLEPQPVKGIKIVSNVSYYIGEFNEGFYDGEGKLYEDGTITRGIWDVGFSEKILARDAAKFICPRILQQSTSEIATRFSNQLNRILRVTSGLEAIFAQENGFKPTVEDLAFILKAEDENEIYQLYDSYQNALSDHLLASSLPEFKDNEFNLDETTISEVEARYINSGVSGISRRSRYRFPAQKLFEVSFEHKNKNGVFYKVFFFYIKRPFEEGKFIVFQPYIKI